MAVLRYDAFSPGTVLTWTSALLEGLDVQSRVCPKHGYKQAYECTLSVTLIKQLKSD